MFLPEEPDGGLVLDAGSLTYELEIPDASAPVMNTSDEDEDGVYCHKCGKESKTSCIEPICKDCR